MLSAIFYFVQASNIILYEKIIQSVRNRNSYICHNKTSVFCIQNLSFPKTGSGNTRTVSNMHVRIHAVCVYMLFWASRNSIQNYRRKRYYRQQQTSIRRSRYLYADGRTDNFDDYFYDSDIPADTRSHFRRRKMR